MEINTAQSPYALLKTIPLKNLCLKDGFCSGRQATKHEISLKHAYRKLKASGNFNDYIDSTSGLRNRDGVPGNPEIELALTELSGESSQPRYLALAAFLLTNIYDDDVLAERSRRGGTLSK